MVKPSTLLGALKHYASRSPESPFLTVLRGRQTYSYSEAYFLAAQLCVFLRQQNFLEGSKVLLLSENTWIFIPLLAACAASNVALVPIDPKTHVRELALILDDVKPVLVLNDDGYQWNGVLDESMSVPLSRLLSIARSLPADYSDRRVEAGRGPTLLIYTSGTSGSGKAVVLSESNLMANAETFVSTYNITRADRFLCVLPFFHMNAILVTGCTPLLAGAHLFVSDIFGHANAKFYIKVISENHITVCSLVPSIMAILLKLHPIKPGLDLSALRFAFCGAAPLPAALWSEFEARFGIIVYQGYGLTETTCWATFTPPGLPRRYSTVGIPIGCEVRIDAKAIRKSATRYGEVQGGADVSDTVQLGEVLIRGDILMLGYHRRPKLTKSSRTVDGFFRTGDVGFVDKDGFLSVRCRKKEVVIKNGTNIIPTDVDKVIMECPQIQECKTVGVPDDIVGERLVSVCVARSGEAPTAQTIRNFASARMSAFMVPDKVLFMGYLPKSSTGKISEAKLQKILSGELTADIFASINTWKVKRAQPSSAKEIRDIIHSSVLAGTSINFVSYWGCGKRDAASDSDRIALARMGDFIRSAERPPHVTAKLTLVLTDTHAILNGKPRDRSGRYFREIRALADEHGFEVTYMSHLWEKNGLDLGDILSEEPGAGSVLDSSYGAGGHVSEEHISLLEQAKRHSERDDADVAARKYLRACRGDSNVMQREFPASIFLTYNGPSSAITLPSMPTMYIYSTRPKFSEKPWFCDQ